MSEDFPSDELLDRIAGQDVAALGEIYDRYAPRVYGLIVHIVSSRDAAEEILQEVFVRLWSESPNLGREGGSMVAWLVVTARAAAVHRVRALRENASGVAPQSHGANPEKAPVTGARKSKGAALLASPSKSLDGKAQVMKPHPAEGAISSALVPAPPAWLPQPREIIMIDDRLVLLHKAIDQLPKPQRQALELAVFGGLSESEIAAEMGEPLAKTQRSLRAAVTFVKHRRRAVCGTWAANI